MLLQAVCGPDLTSPVQSVSEEQEQQLLLRPFHLLRPSSPSSTGTPAAHVNNMFFRTSSDDQTSLSTPERREEWQRMEKLLAKYKCSPLVEPQTRCEYMNENKN